jgi:hypothetical protein
MATESGFKRDVTYLIEKWDVESTLGFGCAFFRAGTKTRQLVCLFHSSFSSRGTRLALFSAPHSGRGDSARPVVGQEPLWRPGEQSLDSTFGDFCQSNGVCCAKHGLGLIRVNCRKSAASYLPSHIALAGRDLRMAQGFDATPLESAVKPIRLISRACRMPSDYPRFNKARVWILRRNYRPLRRPNRPNSHSR